MLLFKILLLSLYLTYFSSCSFFSSLRFYQIEVPTYSLPFKSESPWSLYIFDRDGDSIIQDFDLLPTELPLYFKKNKEYFLLFYPPSYNHFQLSPLGLYIPRKAFFTSSLSLEEGYGLEYLVLLIKKNKLPSSFNCERFIFQSKSLSSPYLIDYNLLNRHLEKGLFSYWTIKKRSQFLGEYTLPKGEWIDSRSSFIHYKESDDILWFQGEYTLLKKDLSSLIRLQFNSKKEVNELIIPLSSQ